MKSFLGVFILLVILGGVLFVSVANKIPLTIRNDTSFAPTAMPSSTPSVSPQPSVEESSQEVNVYLVAINDNGKKGELIGCGDSVVAVKKQVSQTKEVLNAALEQLLSLKQQTDPESGMYNALYQSNLHIDSLDIANGKATIKLSGQLQLGGVCDEPRVKAQLTETARQFKTVNSVAIFVNNKPLDEALSQK
jgi:spore germination protein GerM